MDYIVKKSKETRNTKTSLVKIRQGMNIETVDIRVPVSVTHYNLVIQGFQTEISFSYKKVYDIFKAHSMTIPHRFKSWRAPLNGSVG